jgi:Uncharacterized alpha/beta hydrolase domain (DUF2235)
VPGDRFREVWFAGVHSDVGGVCHDDHRLSDIALQWMTGEAAAAGLVVDGKAYPRHLDTPPNYDRPGDLALGKVHDNELGWAVLGLGWHRRAIRPADEVHPSVPRRMELTAASPRPYAPRLPALSARHPATR